jgi:hypothetical protein
MTTGAVPDESFDKRGISVLVVSVFKLLCHFKAFLHGHMVIIFRAALQLPLFVLYRAI